MNALVAAVFAALSAAPDPIDRALEAATEIAAWRVEDARPAVEGMLSEFPEHPLTHAVVGQLKFHLGDHRGATDAFAAARAGGAPPGLLSDAEAAEQARLVTEGYEEHVGEHFVIRHPPGKDALLVPFAVEVLEAARTSIGDLLGFRPKERVVVEIYPTAKSLAAVSALTPKDIETSGTIALCRWNRLMATSPRAVVFGYPWRDTLAHELAHLIIGGASRDTVPIWLHEGLAKYTETAWRGQPGLGVSADQLRRLREAAEKDELIPFSAMHPSMAKLPSQEAASLAFTEVFSFIEFLVAKKGWPGIRALLTEMSNGKSDREGIEAVYGMPFPQMEEAWRASLLKGPIKAPGGPRPVKGEHPIALKDRPDVPDDELAGLSDAARRHARAADLLFSRGRPLAAQRELERAFEEGRSPLVSAKLAALSLANDDLERAEQAARASVEARPELAGPNVTLAEILLRRGDRDGMAAPLSRAVDTNPFDPRIHRLTLEMLGPDGQKDAVQRAKASLALAETPSAAPRPLDLGRGARVAVLGTPFSRLYLRRDGRRYATQLVTPTPAIELGAGTWTFELVPPRGPPIEQTATVTASLDVVTITVPEAPNTR